MYDPRTNLSAEVDAEVRKHLGQSRVRDRHPAKRPTLGSAQLRPAHRPLPARFQGRGSVRRAGGGDARTRREARTRVPCLPTRASAAAKSIRDRRRETALTPPRLERHTGLGRGLGALIPQTSPAGAAPVEIPISRIRGNPYQPRQRVEQQALESLAGSIAIHGVLQPVLVTEVLDGYQLVAGERRVRAAQMAGLDRVPAIVRQMAQRDQLAVALVENVQRADLNAMEEAHAYRQLADEFGLTQDEIATRVGRARSTVANTLAAARPRAARPAGAARTATSPKATPEPWRGRRRPGSGNSSRPWWPADLSVRQTEELVRRLRERPAHDRRGRERPRRGDGAPRGGPPPRAGHQGPPGPIAGRADAS